MSLKSRPGLYSLRIAALGLLSLITLTFSCSAFSTPIKNVKNILMVVAMDDEATKIIKILNLKPAQVPDKNLPMKAYSGSYANLNVYLVLNGTDPAYQVENIGSQPATLSTYLGIKNFHPDLVMNIGTAGGFPSKNAKIGDIYISNKIYFYDRRLHSPDYKLYGNGNYTSPNTQDLVKSLGIKTGAICSGDSFEDDQTDLKVLAEEGCSVKEMEAAGVAWVSMLEKIPMVALKGITDHVGHISNHDQFEKNFNRVNEKIAIKTRDILLYLSQRNKERQRGQAPMALP